MMRTKLGLLAVLTFVCAAAQSAVRIPLEEDQGQFWIEGRIGDSEPLLIAFDTGAGATVIHQPVAEKLGLQPRRTSTLGGAGGRVASGIIEKVDVTLGGVQLNDLTLQAIDLGPIHARSGKQTAMIIGYDVLRRYVTEIDYDTHELVLHEPRTYAVPSSMTAVPIEIRENHPYVRASATVGGTAESGLFVLDTGSNSSVIFTPGVARSRKLAERMKNRITARAGGVGGEFEMTIGRIDSVALGGFTIEQPVGLFPERGQFATSEAIGNLGGQILRRFRAVFDYPRRRLYLAPSKKFNERDEVDMSGLMLMMKGTQMQISRVRDATPAAEAGLRVGDELVAFEGAPAADLRAIRGQLRKPDVEYRLRIRRDGQEQDVRLRTKRFI